MNKYGFYALKFDKTNSIVLHNTKAGCSTLKIIYAYLENDMDLSTKEGIDEHIHSIVQVTDLFKIRKIKKYIASNINYRYLVVGRNPFKRLISSFLDKRVYFDNEELKGSSFLEVVSWLEKLFNKNKATLHTRPSYPLGLEHIPSYFLIDIDKESLTESLSELWKDDLSENDREWLLKLKRYKKTQNKESQESFDGKACLHDRPVDLIKKIPRKEIDYRRFYNFELAEKVYQMYKKDCELMGYDTTCLFSPKPQS